MNHPVADVVPIAETPRPTILARVFTLIRLCGALWLLLGLFAMAIKAKNDYEIAVEYVIGAVVGWLLAAILRNVEKCIEQWLAVFRK